MNHADQIAEMHATLKSFTFGVEIECLRLTRAELASVVAGAVGGGVSQRGGSYDKYLVVLPDGREWTCMTDGSLTDAYGRAGEVVTPIMKYGDLEMLQKVIRALSGAGAQIDSSCGIHVHVGVEKFDGAAISRLAKLVYQQEELIFASLGVARGRRGTYCRPVNEDMIKRIVERRPDSREAVARAWYNGEESYAATQHYHGSRYHGLNLHSIFFRGTVEFRYFEGTLHAGKVKTYVQLCLAIAAKALLGKATVARKRAFNMATAKYDFRVFLLRLALIGDEFKTARHHLLQNMPGTHNYRNGKPATVTAPPAPAQS